MSPNVGPSDAPKDAPLGLGRGVLDFFCIGSCWQYVKTLKGLVKVRGFHCIGAGSDMKLDVVMVAIVLIWDFIFMFLCFDLVLYIEGYFLFYLSQYLG